MDLLEEMVVNKDFLLREDVYNISKSGNMYRLDMENDGRLTIS